jgi:hypothetical protein
MPRVTPPSDSRLGKRSQLPDDYRLESDDAPNWSWTDLVSTAAAAFLCFADRGANSRPASTRVTDGSA